MLQHIPTAFKLVAEKGLTLQHTSKHCNAAQCTATYCKALLQHTATHCNLHCNKLQRKTTTHFNALPQYSGSLPSQSPTLQRHCNTLQQTTAHCTTLLLHTATHYSTLQHCNILQPTVTQYYSTLQHTTTASRLIAKSKFHSATHCNTLQHTATHSQLLLHTSTHYNSIQAH